MCRDPYVSRFGKYMCTSHYAMTVKVIIIWKHFSFTKTYADIYIITNTSIAS